jgi:glycerophosphoryl diester phosphodiesterase
VIVMAHDSHLNPQIVRHADGRWIEPPGAPIRSLTLAQLRAYDVGRLRPEGDYARQWPRQKPADGERFPTLTELIELVKAQPRPVALNLETKITPSSGVDVVAPAEFARRVVDAGRAKIERDRTVLRLAYAARGPAAGARDRHRLPDHRNRAVEHRATRARRGIAVARRPEGRRSWRLRAAAGRRGRELDLVDVLGRSHRAARARGDGAGP